MCYSNHKHIRNKTRVIWQVAKSPYCMEPKAYHHVLNIPSLGPILGWLAGPRPHIYSTVSLQTKLLAKNDEPMARVSEMVLGIHRCTNLCYFFCPTSVPILWRMCIYIHKSDCAEFVYELPLLPNNTANERFSHKSGAVWSVDWIFTTGMTGWR